MKILGLILAGGHSSRMGRDKAGLEFDGKSLIQNQIETFKNHGFPIAISSNTYSLDVFKPIPVLEDPAEIRYGGPLAGVYAGLNYAFANNYDFVLTMPVDCPIIPEEFFARITSDIDKNTTMRMASTPSGLQPTFALWPTPLRSDLFEFLKGSENKSIRSFAFAHNVSIVRFDNTYSEGAFFNVNTPEDYQYLQDKFGIKNETKA